MGGEKAGTNEQRNANAVLFFSFHLTTTIRRRGGMLSAFTPSHHSSLPSTGPFAFIGSFRVHGQTRVSPSPPTVAAKEDTWSAPPVLSSPWPWLPTRNRGRRGGYKPAGERAVGDHPTRLISDKTAPNLQTPTGSIERSRGPTSPNSCWRIF